MNIAKAVWEHNENKIGKFLQQINVIKTNSLEDYENKIRICLDEYEQVIINLIGCEKNYAQYFIEQFGMESGVEFLLGNDLDSSEKPYKAVFTSLNDKGNQLIDYTKITLTSEITNENQLTFVESGMASEIAVERNEKRLCKMVAKSLKNGQSIRVHTYDKQTLNYLKGLLKGVGAASNKLAFILDVGSQYEDLMKMRSELYSVIPMVNLQENREMYEIKKKVLTGFQN